MHACGHVPAPLAELPSGRRVALVRTSVTCAPPVEVPPARRSTSLPHGATTHGAASHDRDAASRRAVLRAAPLLLLSQCGGAPAVRAAPELGAGAALPVARYTDAKNHFAVEYPATWAPTQKDGAAVLFTDPGDRINTLGVTVSPVTVQSLAQVGSLEAVTDKLVKAERDKDGTLEVDVGFSRERQSAGSGTPVYEFEYTVQHATRGNKTVVTAVCIEQKTLYILALQWRVGSADKPLPVPLVAALAPQLLASFQPGTVDGGDK
jgi:hypothetical protein